MKEERTLRRMQLLVDIPGERRRGRPNLIWKDACARDMTDAGLKGRRTKQGSMEEKVNQLQQRPQMTGRARDDEEEEEILADIASRTVIRMLVG